MAPRQSQPPRVGRSRPEKDGFERGDHTRGWNLALDRALEEIGRPAGYYQVRVELGATIDVENPGHIIEYVATII